MGDDRDATNQNRLHHLLWECFISMTPVMDGIFADTELTLALAGTLDEIGSTPGATVSDIARRTPKTQQAISQAAAKLEKLGWVERRLGGGRGVGLWLTPAGEDARADGIAREVEMEDRLREILGTAVYDDLLGALERGSARFRTQTELTPATTKASEP